MHFGAELGIGEWMLQGGVPVNVRSCNHLKELLGNKYEAAFMKLKNPELLLHPRTLPGRGRRLMVMRMRIGG